MPVHVSIHDVSPAWEREVELALEMTHAVGVRPALLVVPNFHGRAPLDKHPAYVERLRALADDGHEIYLHGYYHRAGMPNADGEPTARRSLVERLRHGFAQKVVSASEAELSDVSRDEAMVRLTAGERMLEDVGLPNHGFIAPAWSMPGWVVPWLGARGYRFTEDHLRIHDPATGRARPSVVLNYASRTPSRLLTSVAWCRAARPGRRVLPARIAIHPADMRYALLRSEILSLLDWASGDFVATGRELMS